MTTKFLSLLIFAFALPAQATTIALTPSSAPSAGSSFDVVVQISNVFATHPGDAIAGFGFDVTVDPSFLSFTGETIGSLFDDFSGIFGPIPQVAGIADGGGPGFFVAGDFTEPLTLATLHFLALAPGSSTVAIATDLSDPNQGLFYSTAGANPLNASTNVIIASVPEPGTMLLGGLALTLFTLYRRRRSSFGSRP